MERTMREKILLSAKKGDLLHKAKRKMHSYFPLYWIHNKNIVFQNYACNVYKKLYRKYAELIEDDKEDVSLSHELSDKVWICWFQGYDAAPQIVKAAISSVKKNMPEKEVIILSDETIPVYAEFPREIIEKRRQGKISAAHYSDLLRIDLLCRYGGMWVDATVLCTSDKVPQYISNTPLFVYKSMDLTGLDMMPTICSSWLISAHSNNTILLLTRKLLWQYWKDFSFAQDYFIFHFFLAMAARKYSKQWAEIPLFNNASPHVLQNELFSVYSDERWEQIKGMSVFHKLNHHKDYSKGEKTFYQHIVTEYLGTVGK